MRNPTRYQNLGDHTETMQVAYDAWQAFYEPVLVAYDAWQAFYEPVLAVFGRLPSRACGDRQ